MIEGGIVRDQHFRHAGQFRRGRRCAGKVDAGDQHMDLTEGRGGGDRTAGGLLDAAIVEFEKNETRHGQITFASVLSLLTNSATDLTFWPALRFGGSLTLIKVKRGVTSTPRSAGFMLAIGFFRAFMIFGSEA